MTNPIKEQLAEDLQQAKVTSQARATRIKKIVQAAAAQAMTEVKAGSGEVRSIAQNRFQAVIETAHEKLDRQTSTSSVNASSENTTVNTIPVDTIPTDTIPTDTIPTDASTTPVSLKTLIVKLFRVAQAKLFDRVRQEYRDFPRQYEDLKQQATQVDAKLNQRYGDRYQQVKQRVRKAKVWYAQKRSQGEALKTPLVEQKQSELATQAGAAGTAIAQKEQQVRQQVKAFLQTAANKL